MKNKLLYLIAPLLVASACTGLHSQNRVREVKAASVDEFLGSMGVCSSVAGRGEKLDETIENLRYTGLRWVRAGYEDEVPVEDFIRLYRETGVKTSYGLLSGGSDTDRLLDDARALASADALLAVEGANEPNNWAIIYKGKEGGSRGSWLPVARLHADLYRAVKSDPQLKNYPVWALSEAGAQSDDTGLQFLEIPAGANTLMPAGTKYADFANCHNYISHPSWPGLHDNQTWLASSPLDDCPVDGLYGNYGLTWAGKFAGYSPEALTRLPRVTTETGYAITPADGVTEDVQARLFMNLYLSQFKRGWKHTAIYLLKGRANEPDHERYAFYTLDNRPKLAAHYIHNFTRILADRKGDRKPETLSYEIANQPATTHDLLLQRSDGVFLLVLWGERFSSGGEDALTVEFGARHAKVKIYDPTVSEEVLNEYRNVNSLDVSLSDHPVIVEIGK